MAATGRRIKNAFFRLILLLRYSLSSLIIMVFSRFILKEPLFCPDLGPLLKTAPLS
jgi:hypothetical protein